MGHDSQTSMFDFLDNSHIVVHYNRQLVSVDLNSGELEVLCHVEMVDSVAAGADHL